MEVIIVRHASCAVLLHAVLSPILPHEGQTLVAKQQIRPCTRERVFALSRLVHHGFSRTNAD